MSWWESFRIALRALRAGKLRSFLTMLGIIIGVASVITVVAVGSGAQNQIAEQIRSLGSNVLMIYSTASSGGRAQGSVQRHLLSESDARAVVEQIPLVTLAAPFGWASAQIIRGNRNNSTVLWGTTSDYFAVREWPLKSGRLFFPEEEEGAGKQVVLGATVAQRLFGIDDPVGSEVRVDNVPFQVIGVLTERGGAGSARSLDRDIFVPIATAKRRVTGAFDSVNRDAVEYILVKVAREDAMEEAQTQIEMLLSQRHRLHADSGRSFRIGNPAAEMAVQQGTATTFSWLLASVASISLIVGGISIMNIMLVSVTERTREIGLRLAVGARRGDVRNQFLIEAVTLCLLGGLIGIAIGIGASVVVAEAAGWPVFVGIDAIAVAIGFAVATGIFFGWYPAHKAARLEPVEALRTE